MTDLTATHVARHLEGAENLSPANSGLRLRSELRVCRIGPRFVFLDVSASRYFLLEGGAAECFLSFCDNTADAEAIGWLQQQQIVETGAPLTPPPPSLSPARSLFDLPLSPVRPWLVAEALCEQIAASRRVRREPLVTLLGHAEADGVNLDACRPIAAACRAAARYRSATDQCLPNALAMRRMLARRGIPADLVIGVMLPFAAHCWLQSGDTVLSDPFGHVQNFHPLVAA